MAVQGHAAAQATPSASPSSQGGICNVSSRPLLCPPHACGRHGIPLRQQALSRGGGASEHRVDRESGS